MAIRQHLVMNTISTAGQTLLVEEELIYDTRDLDSTIFIIRFVGSRVATT